MEAFFTLVLLLISQLFGYDVGGEQTPSDKNWVAEETALVLSVIDGDTIKVQLNGVEETVRYIGMDTPEPYRDSEPACYSQEASSRNRELVAGREVQLIADIEDRDKYDRLLRYVYVDDVFVNEQLVSEGYATTLTIRPNTRFETQFSDAQTDARSANRGLWSACR